MAPTLVLKEKILQLIRIKGPIVPTQLTRDVGQDSFIIGAHLSELVSEKRLHVTSIKKGTSKFYYLPGQESRLENLFEYLNSKDKEVVEILKVKKVLPDEICSPFQKVALRNLKDYAIPLRVNNLHLFWKYYLIPQTEAVDMIKKHFENHEEQIAKVVKKLEPKKAEEEKRPKSVQETLLQPEEKIIAAVIEPVIEAALESEPTKLDTLQPEKPASQKKTYKKREPKIAQTPLTEITEDPSKDEFFIKIKEYLDSKNISISNVQIIKKDQEYTLNIEVPAPIGSIPFFCIAKNKKSNSIGDLSAAYLLAQKHQLPLLFVTSGKISQKGKSMQGKELKQAILHEL